MIDLKILREGLEELTSEELQEELWLNGTAEWMSTPEEAICGVFDDAGLTRALDNGYVRQAYSEEIEEKAQRLSKLVGLIPVQLHPREVMAHPLMPQIRATAGELLKLFEGEEAAS